MLHATLLFLSAPDITIILVIALVLFGGKKLPELARGLGSGIKEFKDATSGVTPENNMPKSAPVAEQNTPVIIEHHAQ